MSQHNDILRQFLEAEDVTCPVCRYQLQGLTDNRCPECGKELTLHVRPVESHMRRFVVACVGLSMGFGFFAIFLGMTIIGFIVQGGGWPPGYIFATVVGLTAAEGVALLILVKKSASFARASIANQRSLAFGCCALTTVLAVIFAIMIFSR